MSLSTLYMKDLLSMEAKQNRELDELQNRHKHLTWKLESLMYVNVSVVLVHSLTIYGRAVAPDAVIYTVQYLWCSI